jgi:aminoglycoside/choline kinase family phosphotransferase
MSHPHASANQTSTTAPDGGPAKVQWNDPQRAAAFARWLHALVPVHGLRPETLAPASADASFRRYLRIAAAGGSLIIMDAPPDKEDSRPFDHVAGLMARAGLLVPQVLDWSQQSGFLLLTDLGCQSMMQAINTEQPAANLALYQQAVEALVTWQLASRPGVLPPFDAALMRRELDLFAQWYMVQHRKMVLDAGLQRTLDTLFETIIAECLAWPSVYVHADFMPRNLMLQQPAVGSDTPVCRLGVLDFQDAVYGPITYDIASLMRDAFLSWDEDFVLDVTIRYWELARRRGLPVGDDFGAFYRGVEWMGLQRHLRIAGVFARLSLRDGKPQYLADAPRFIGYLRATAARYRELRPLSRLLDLIEGTQEAGGFAFGRV